MHVAGSLTLNETIAAPVELVDVPPQPIKKAPASASTITIPEKKTRRPKRLDPPEFVLLVNMGSYLWGDTCLKARQGETSL
jgi:hypothetical protein